MTGSPQRRLRLLASSPRPPCLSLGLTRPPPHLCINGRHLTEIPVWITRPAVQMPFARAMQSAGPCCSRGVSAAGSGAAPPCTSPFASVASAGGASVVGFWGSKMVHSDSQTVLDTSQQTHASQLYVKAICECATTKRAAHRFVRHCTPPVLSRRLCLRGSRAWSGHTIGNRLGARSKPGSEPANYIVEVGASCASRRQVLT